MIIDCPKKKRCKDVEEEECEDVPVEKCRSVKVNGYTIKLLIRIFFLVFSFTSYDVFIAAM
jgi:hypothetical protein